MLYRPSTASIETFCLTSLKSTKMSDKELSFLGTLYAYPLPCQDVADAKVIHTRKFVQWAPHACPRAEGFCKLNACRGSTSTQPSTSTQWTALELKVYRTSTQKQSFCE